MDNKERNQIILDLAAELLEKVNIEVKDGFVEDMEVGEGEEEGKQVMVSLTVENPAPIIGFKGKNLAAFQLILGLMVKVKVGEWVRVLVDVNNYRGEQRKRLETMVENLVEKAKQTGRAVMMVPMSSYERRICHMIAAQIGGVTTQSEGEDEQRHVVIRPAESTLPEA